MSEESLTITGVRPRPRPRGRRFLVLYLGLIVILVVYGVLRHRWDSLVLYGFYAVALAWPYLPPTRVSASGIRRPWRPRSVVSWDDVASVVGPQLGVTGVRLNLRNGKQAVLSDIANSRAGDVAAVGGKDLVPVAVPPRPPTTPRAPSDDERAAAVTRSARALAVQRDELAALSKRLRRS